MFTLKVKNFTYNMEILQTQQNLISNNSISLLSPLLFLLLIVCSCSHSYREVQTRHTAQATYDTMQQATLELEATIATFNQQKNSISIQGRALTEEEVNFLNQVSDVTIDFEQWKKNVVAVPTSFQSSQEATFFLKEQEKQMTRLDDIYRQAKKIKEGKIKKSW